MEVVQYGRRIQQARLKKGLSLEDVSYELKINLKTLMKIENSETQELPKAPFTKGFIKTYCVYLGLEPDAIVADYENTLPESSQGLRKGVLAEEEGAGKVFAFDVLKNQIIPIVALFCTIVGVGAAYKFLIQEGASSSMERMGNLGFEAQQSTQIEAPKVGKDEVEKLEVSRLDEPVIEKENLKLQRVATVYQGQEIKAKPVKTAVDKKVEQEKVQPKPMAKNFKNKLVVEPLAETYIYIKTDLDEKPVRASLKPDVTRVFKFDSAEIRFLDAGAVNLILNGEDVGSLGSFGEAKKIEFPTMKEL